MLRLVSLGLGVRDVLAFMVADMQAIGHSAGHGGRHALYARLLILRQMFQ